MCVRPRTYSAAWPTYVVGGQSRSPPLHGTRCCPSRSLECKDGMHGHIKSNLLYTVPWGSTVTSKRCGAASPAIWQSTSRAASGSHATHFGCCYRYPVNAHILGDAMPFQCRHDKERHQSYPTAGQVATSALLLVRHCIAHTVTGIEAPHPCPRKRGTHRR